MIFLHMVSTWLQSYGMTHRLWVIAPSSRATAVFGIVFGIVFIFGHIYIIRGQPRFQSSAWTANYDNIIFSDVYLQSDDFHSVVSRNFPFHPLISCWLLLIETSLSQLDNEWWRRWAFGNYKNGNWLPTFMKMNRIQFIMVF